jgi:hypothetical protein
MRKTLTLIAAFVVAIFIAAPASAGADSFVVDELTDAHDADFGGTPDGVCDRDEGTPGEQCPLRAALEEASASAAPVTDTVTFSVSGTHHVTLGDLTVNAVVGAPISVVGNGQAGGTTIDADATDRVMSAAGSSVSLSDLRIEDGKVTGASGAGIESQAGLLTLDRVTVANNRIDATIGSEGGAGISTISSTHALHLNDSTVSGNTIGLTASGAGAGIRVRGQLRLNRSTVSGNNADAGAGTASEAGGIKLTTGVGATHSIANSTISGNQAGTGGGGGLFASNGDTLTITNSTIAGNSATGGASGAGIVSFAATTITNTIVAGNTSPAGESCAFGASVAKLNNIESPGATCGFGSVNGNQENVTAPALDLGVLASNGGPTQTRAIGPSSVAIGAGDNAACAAAPVDGIDQRNIARPQGAVCDAGAFERVLPPAPPNLASVVPSSGANDNSPRVIGSAPAGTTVRLYTDATCATAVPGGSGTDAVFASPGIQVSVADNSSTTFFATAEDANGTSSCSTSSVTYSEVTPPPAKPANPRCAQLRKKLKKATTKAKKKKIRKQLRKLGC